MSRWSGTCSDLDWSNSLIIGTWGPPEPKVLNEALFSLWLAGEAFKGLSDGEPIGFVCPTLLSLGGSGPKDWTTAGVIMLGFLPGPWFSGEPLLREVLAPILCCMFVGAVVSAG